MTTTRIQDERIASATTSLGGNVLLLRSMAGTEQMSRLFQFDVSFYSDKDRKAQFDRVLGTGLGVQLKMVNNATRYFHGVVSRFYQAADFGRLARYHATVVPWLWLLTRRSDCRLFQRQTAPDIIKDVFKKAGFSDQADFEDRLTGTYREWEYCVQYRETDFNFVSRLMEHEGIYYFFEHSADRHKLVLADSRSAHTPFPGYGQIEYHSMSAPLGGKRYAWDVTVGKEVRTGRYAVNDYDFKAPRKVLLADHAGAHAYEHGDAEFYDYPGIYLEPGEGTGYARTRLEELGADEEVLTAQSDAEGVSPGRTFTLSRYPRDDRNREYLVTSVTYDIDQDEYDSAAPDVRGGGGGGGRRSVFMSRLSAVSTDVPYRPGRVTPKPVVQGPQTAVVMGPKGQELYVDMYGRVKVRFHWDRNFEGRADEDRSCWIRVAQPVAGKRWGASFWPRIGQEVVVQFLEGDPDQPLIVGAVYNGEQMPPYLGDGPDGKHPADPKVSGFKTNSTMGGEGFNELRFDDTKGAEQVFVHAERNMDVRVKNDVLERVYGNFHSIVGWEKDGGKGGDLREMIYQDYHLDVKRHVVQHVEGNVQLLVGRGGASGGGNVDVSVEKDRSEKVGGTDHLHVVRDRNEAVDGSVSVTVGRDRQEKVGGRHATDATTEIHLKAGMKVVIEAGVQLTLKAGGGFVDIGPAGVTIQGTLVNINSGGAAGSGGGAGPAAPVDPQEANPTEPDLADDAKTGRKSAPD